MGKLKMVVEVRPLSGKSTNKTVKVEATGVSVTDLLKAAKVDPTKKGVLVNGQPVADLSILVAADAKVCVQERAQGS